MKRIKNIDGELSSEQFTLDDFTYNIFSDRVGVSIPYEDAYFCNILEIFDEDDELRISTSVMAVPYELVERAVSLYKRYKELCQ